MTEINKKQFSDLCLSLVLVRLFFTLPRQMLISAGNSAWILSIYLTLIALLMFFIITKFYKTNESPLEIAERTGGRGFKIITGLAAMAILILKSTGPIKIFLESVQIILLKNTNIELTVIFLGITIFIGAYSGIFSLSFLSGIFTPFVLFILGSFLLFLIPDFNISNLTPILGKGAKSIFIDGLSSLSLFGDLFVIFFLLPFVKEENILKRCSFRAIIFIGTILTITLIIYAGIFPYPISSEFILPLFQLTRTIEIGDFFGRLEAFFELIWALSFLIYASLNIYTLSIIFKKTFDLKYEKPIILPMTIITIAVGFFEPSIVELIEGDLKYSWVIIGALFLFPLIFGLLSRKGEKKI